MRIYLHRLLDPEGDQELSTLPLAKRWLTVALRIFAFFALLGVCFIVVALLEQLLIPLVIHVSHPPASAADPPLLSNAQYVQVTQTGNPGGKIISYQTDSTPDDVYAFYATALTKDGWGGQGYISATPELVDGSIVFEWDQIGLDGCEPLGYTLLLTARKTDSSITNVRIEITQTTGC